MLSAHEAYARTQSNPTTNVNELISTIEIMILQATERREFKIAVPFWNLIPEGTPPIQKELIKQEIAKKLRESSYGYEFFEANINGVYWTFLKVSWGAWDLGQ